MEKRKRATLTSQDARKQTKAAAVLMSIIPALVVFFMGSLTYFPERAFPLTAQVGILTFTTLLAFAGYRIISKYSENILKLRQYIGEVAKGALPEEIVLPDTQNSDDIKYIEESFNAILAKMRQQQQNLVDAERHRTMIQSLGAACHHLSQPASVLCMRLQLLREDATSDEVRTQLDESLGAVEQIRDILGKLGRVSEFKTVPYIEGDPIVGNEILDID